VHLIDLIIGNHDKKATFNFVIKPISGKQSLFVTMNPSLNLQGFRIDHCHGK